MATAPRPSFTVMIVESPVVRDLIRTILEKERYTVLEQDEAGAIEALRRGEPPIDLLITNMPWHFEPYPEGMRVLYISGAPNREFLLQKRGGAFGYLQKPFRFHELLQGVRELLPAGETRLTASR